LKQSTQYSDVYCLLAINSLFEKFTLYI